MAPPAVDLFADLVSHTHAVVRRDEGFIACPECGKTSTPAAVHFSFSPRGCYCFSCGYKASLAGLARRLGLGERVYNAPPRLQEAPRRPASWLSSAEHLIDGYTAHARVCELWQAYKPLSQETIRRMRLGVGRLPLSKCHHERLVVPVYDGTMVVGLRGRAMGCGCPKWLAPAGTLISLYPLYNEASLRPGCTAVVVENPIDALMLSERLGVAGVATFSVAYWQERWTEALAAGRPALVMVAYDNDAPGLAAGVKLTNRLLEAGLPAQLWRWPAGTPAKYDVGSMLAAASC